MEALERQRKSWEERIRLAQEFSELNEEGADIFQRIQQLHEFDRAKNHKELARGVLELHAIVDKLEDTQLNDLERQAKREYNILSARRQMEDIVTKLEETPQHLLAFAFYLRQLDKGDQYTMTVLEGQVKPPCLVSLIIANQWDAKLQVMKVRPDCFFTIQRNDDKAYLVRDPKQKGLLISADGDQAGLDSRFQFVLTADGFQIKQQDASLLAEENALQENGHTPLVQDRVSASYKSRWMVVPEQRREDLPLFFLELEEGDLPPRLTASDEKLRVTTRKADGYYVKEQSVWLISQHGN